MNDTLKVLEKRRSCRNFKSDMIPEETLEQIVRAGTYAPTGMGKQSPIILAVTNKELRDQLSEENRKIMGAPESMDPFYGAPVILVVLANKAVPTHVYDGSLVMGNLMNAAESLGVASIWIHRAKEEFESDFGKKILADLGIQGEYEGIGHCALGYASSRLVVASRSKVAKTEGCSPNNAKISALLDKPKARSIRATQKKMMSGPVTRSLVG